MIICNKIKGKKNKRKNQFFVARPQKRQKKFSDTKRYIAVNEWMDGNGWKAVNEWEISRDECKFLYFKGNKSFEGQKAIIIMQIC